MTTTENETKVENQQKNVEEVLVEKSSNENDKQQQQQEQPASPTKSKTETLKNVPQVHKKDFEKDVVYLYQFVRSGTIPSLSSCCLKVENWLRMLGIRYENVDHKLRFKSKKGQLPFVELNGKEFDDSEQIISSLSKTFDKDLDFGLTDEQKTTSHAFISMLNNHTGWLVRWWRYNHPQEFFEAAQLDIKKTFNSRFPSSILNFVFKLGFKKHLRDSLGLGSGRFTLEEVIEAAKGDLKALSNLLGTKDYFFGKEPHLLDCIAFAHLAQFIYVPFGGLKEWMETDTPNLIELVNRMKSAYWTDWDEMCSTLELNTHLPKKEVPEEQEQKDDEESKKKKEKEEKKKKEKKEKKDKKKESTKEKSAETKEEAPKADETGKEAGEVKAEAPNGGDVPKEVKAE